jgi:cytoskeletal protein RodZ
MKLIDDDSEDKEKLAPPDDPPAIEAPPADRSTRTETERVNPPAVIRWIFLIIIVLIIAFLILLLARWVYHKVHHKSAPAVSTSQQSGTSSNQSAQSGTNQQSSGTSGSNGTSSTSGNTATPNKNLPNNGPGNVAGVFVASSLAAGGLHYIYRLRRFNKSGY